MAASSSSFSGAAALRRPSAGKSAVPCSSVLRRLLNSSAAVPSRSRSTGPAVIASGISNVQGARRVAAESVMAVASDEPALATPSTRPERVRRVHSGAEYERELAAEGRLLVVEFTRESLPNTQRTYAHMVELTSTTPDVHFLRVFADQSEELRELTARSGVSQLPSYVFFRDGERVHEATGMQPDKLRDQVLYYGEAQYPVHQLESAEAMESLLTAHEDTGRLVVVQVTLTFCGPCAKVYPAVLQMSHKMAGEVVFGRLFGDRNDGTKALLSKLGIVEAPTFLFYRKKQLLGRYVGSGKGELIGEVLRHQGVDCT